MREVKCLELDGVKYPSATSTLLTEAGKVIGTRTVYSRDYAHEELEVHEGFACIELAPQL